MLARIPTSIELTSSPAQIPPPSVMIEPTRALMSLVDISYTPLYIHYIEWYILVSSRFADIQY